MKTAMPPARAARNSQEIMLSRVEGVRMGQREGRSFDCYGRAVEGYCDQGGCAHHGECLSVSRLIHTRSASAGS